MCWMNSSLLIAAPMGMKKLYALTRWLEATRGRDRLLVWEARDWHSRPVSGDVWEEPYRGLEDHQMHHGLSFNEAWRKIIELAEPLCSHILSLEVDVIPSSLPYLTEEMFDGKDFWIHGVPWRGSYGRDGLCYEMGFTLASVDTWMEALRQADKERQRLYSIVGHSPRFSRHKVYLYETLHIDDGVDHRMTTKEER